MATTNGVWGIDIGQCALKALRCEYDEVNQILLATAFDYIEYPKILSQPDADPKQLVQEALDQFMERNEFRGDKVAISVPGRNGLARFFQPPPVDAKKLPDIVRYEAKQVIPFALEDVIWDWKQMGGSTVVDGFVMDTEIGLFAMKRDQVFEAIEPFVRCGMELHVVQLAPLAAYNFVAHNLMTEALKKDEYDPENPPPSFVLLSVGTDTTDLVITNGFRLWQRNIPLGGNHFTKLLTKELKLTFAKAEHLKRNVRDADNAKDIIQAMRPVFNDMLTEVQRSIGFFQNIDRKSEIAGLIMMGNAMKLPGLQQYLSKNLGYDIVNVDHACWAARLAGQSVLTSPQFKENMQGFGICYGLCLQGLGHAKLTTNLLPKEIVIERLIRAKKPWVLGTAAAMMLAYAVNFVFDYNQWYKVHPNRDEAGVTWQSAMSSVDNAQSTSTRFKGEDTSRIQKLDKLVALGQELSGNSDRRLLWLELMKAINRALPQDPEIAPNEIPDPATKPIAQRQEIHIEYVETEYFPDLKTWFTDPVKNKYLEELARVTQPAGAVADGSNAATPPGTPPATPAPATEVKGPEGPGWVIEFKGHHFFNADPQTWGGTHVRNTLLKNLREQTVELPTGPGKQMEKFTMDEIGVGFAILAVENKIDKNYRIPNPYFEGLQDGMSGMAGTGGLGAVPGMGATPGLGAAKPGAAKDKKAEDAKKEDTGPPFYIVPRYDFVVQMCWQEKKLSERLQKRQQELEQQQQNQGNNSVAANTTGVTGG